ncbi:unnamed protein product [Heterobilharzia americana]|nr:unnamed protein product [Heterobilharzia americana]
MESVTCKKCSKVCKGDALKASDSFFHNECFRCSVCSVCLGVNSYYEESGSFYCADDYKKVMSQVCCTCHSHIIGNMVTVLNKNFHRNCFFCHECLKTFTPGMRVTFWSEKFFCKQCFQSAYYQDNSELNTDDSLSHIKNNRFKCSCADAQIKLNQKEKELETTSVSCKNKNRSNLSNEFCRELTGRLAVQYSALKHVVDESKMNETSSKKDDSTINTNELEKEQTDSFVTTSNASNIQQNEQEISIPMSDQSLTSDFTDECINSLNNTVQPTISDYDDNSYCSLVQSTTLDQQIMQILPPESKSSPILPKGRVAELVRVLEQAPKIEKDGFEQLKICTSMPKSKSFISDDHQKDYKQENAQNTKSLWCYEDWIKIRKPSSNSNETVLPIKYDITEDSYPSVFTSFFSSSSFSNSVSIPPRPPQNLTNHLNKQPDRLWSRIRSNLPSVTDVNGCNYQSKTFVNHLANTTTIAIVSATDTTEVKNDREISGDNLHILSPMNSNSVSKSSNQVDELNYLSSLKLNCKELQLCNSDTLASKQNNKITHRKRLHKSTSSKFLKPPLKDKKPI